MDSQTQLHSIVDYLAASGQTASQFMLSFFNDKDLVNHPVNDILELGQSKLILDAFLSHPKTSTSTSTWAHNVAKKKYALSIKSLAHKSHGWHFNAFRASAKQLEDFRIEDMAERMRELEPELWDLMDLMLGGGSAQMANSKVTDSVALLQMDVDEGTEYSDCSDKFKPDADDGFAMKSQSRRTPAERRVALRKIVRIQLSPS